MLNQSTSGLAHLVAYKYVHRYFSYVVKEGEDPLRALLNLNCDSLINKILHYLSRLSIQYSFQRIQDKLEELVEYSRFADYVNSWP